MPLSNSDKDIIKLLAKYSFIEKCKEIGFISHDEYMEVCRSWGERALERIDYYLKILNQHHNDVNKFISKMKNAGEWD